MTEPRKTKKPSAPAPKPRLVYEPKEDYAEPEVIRIPTARTPEAKELQLAAMAYDLAEKQFREGTAATPVIVHFLKVGSTREKQELEKLKQDTLLAEAKVKDLANVEEMKKLYVEAMDAMRGYAGHDTGVEDDPDVY